MVERCSLGFDCCSKQVVEAEVVAVAEEKSDFDRGFVMVVVVFVVQ